ncbi:YceD family protein [Ramlibacter albus]|uniref:Large ribosomal RNA subunit accumulation protein YceD n=1 Tax=Ramlibacter albus TaxID=2079448 RepID=A0A923MDH9_9BURK|nr:DUF177 domain-containing protein [Ramlibacter albus]MBC5768363.1 DUF177 domain-containing protein [Ramlibacter albus]
MKKSFDARRLDVRRFAEEGGELSAEDALRDYPRLASEAEGRGDDRPLQWTARGEMRNPRHVQPEVWVHLEAHASLPLICQRCLAPVDIKVDVDRSFRFVGDEATAAAEDDEAEEDVLAESRDFNLKELVEDEVLMGLPVAPRHVICPVLPSFSATDPDFDKAQEGKKNPFEVLKALKPGKNGS